MVVAAATAVVVEATAAAAAVDLEGPRRVLVTGHAPTAPPTCLHPSVHASSAKLPSPAARTREDTAVAADVRAAPPTLMIWLPVRPMSCVLDA